MTETPLRYRQSKRYTQTCTSMFSMVTALRARFSSVWKGWSSPSSTATTSPSTTADSAASCSPTSFRTSGYFSVMSFDLREKIWTPPSLDLWICSRSPSYFHSPVKRLPERRSVTSDRPLEGFASMGFTGMPREMWQTSARVSPSRPAMRAATRRSRLGISLKAWRTAASMEHIRASSTLWLSAPSPFLTSGLAPWPLRAGTVSTKA
mmetsp:Transcript_115179/g.357769  ORF Transcript_115179/g.357769 Transcript_115179/m.357769 type:complete len:207 (+) Transcript_115179:798-1418(+)